MSDSTQQSSVMDDLLTKYPLQIPDIGQDIEGKVLSFGTNSMYVDLGALGTGVILGNELNDGFGLAKKLNPGDKVSATVTNLDNEDGYIELSIRKATEDKVWEDLEAKWHNEELVGIKIIDANKGGLLIQINGINGFLPVSQLAYDHYPRVDGGDKSKILGRLKEYVGQTFIVNVINVDRAENKLIVSEKAARKSEELDLINSYRKGDVVAGEVTGVVDFGIFIKFGKETERKIEGLVHISELSWQLVENPRNMYSEGDMVKAQIIDISNGKISLSIKALQTDPWKEAAKKFKVGDTIEGTVAKNNSFGIFVELPNQIRGLIHSSEISKNKELYSSLKSGETKKFIVLSMEPEEHRISLGLNSIPKVKEVEDKKEFTKKDKKEIVVEEKQEADEKAEKKTVEKKAPRAKTAKKAE
jgi:small subunit ribosomal protein S1